MTSLEGSVVTIYNGHVADMGKLHAVLNRPDIMDLPLVTVPVVGEFRTGKSFLLSYFLRYLINKNLGAEDENLVGFDHKCSSKSVTQGITIWDQPLIVKGYKEDGSEQKIVVLLMDSQGILGGKGDKEVSTRIFALSTMVSSIMVFNLMGQLNEGILDHLELFTANAKQATAADTIESPFLKLLFIIRDWGKKDDHDYGLKGGKTYIDEYFEGEDTKTFDSYFKDTQCYLMPKPGDCVDDKHYNGCLRKLTNNFKKHLKKLTESILNHQHLTRNMKKVGGLTITAGDFCVYFENCTKLLDIVDWNRSTNMCKMNATFNCELAQKAAVKCYTLYMDKKTSSFVNMDTCLLMTSEELDNLGKSATDKAQNEFENMSTFSKKNDSELFAEYEAKMIEDLDNLFESYKQKLENEKQKRLKDEQLKHINTNLNCVKKDKKHYRKLVVIGVCVSALLCCVCAALYQQSLTDAMDKKKLDVENKKKDMEIKEEKEKRKKLERDRVEKEKQLERERAERQTKDEQREQKYLQQLQNEKKANEKLKSDRSQGNGKKRSTLKGLTKLKSVLKSAVPVVRYLGPVGAVIGGLLDLL